MGTANGKETRPVDRRRKHPDDPTKEVFKAAKSGDAVLLNEVLQGMNSGERNSALETKMDASLRCGKCVNEHKTKVTPLILAAKNGNVDCVKVLLKYKADIECRGDVDDDECRGDVDDDYARGRDVNLDLQYLCGGCRPLFVAASYGHLDVVSCLVENGADANATTNGNCTPLMIASRYGHVNLVTFLVERRADINQQDKTGDTALHYAANGEKSEAVKKLLSFGASQSFNSRGLTPLLSASNKGKISVVEDLITRPECTREQRIDALEFLGASLATSSRCELEEGFQYIKRGMEERLADPSHPLLKQPMEPVEAYQNRKESQTLEELAQIEHDRIAILMEGLIIRERILGTHDILIGNILDVAFGGSAFPLLPVFVHVEFVIHAIKISQSCNQSATYILYCLKVYLNILLEFDLFEDGWHNDLHKRQKDILKILELTVVEYEKQGKGLAKELFPFTVVLVGIIVKFKLYEEGKSSCSSLLLQKLFPLKSPAGGDSLLHAFVSQHSYGAASFPFVDIVKLLLSLGFNVNIDNNNGDTPLHRIVTFEARSEDEMHLLTDMLEVLLDGGAHHDFVNNDGKTAMDLAETDEARRILSEKRKLELKCISARAVKKFGLPYSGVVPKTLEKFISMH